MAHPPRSGNKLSAPGGRPTMRDVARLAGGVHPSTVSLALRNHPGISEATRKRVRAAAQKLGYRPDPLLDAFNTHRLEVLPHKALPVIAFVADFESRSALEASPQHRAIWLGARAAAESLHCQIELFLLHKTQLTPERLHSILRARGIVTLVLGACRSHTQRLAFDWKDYSAIKIESFHLDISLDTVTSDYRASTRLACRKLQELGYDRIGLAWSGQATDRAMELARVGYVIEQSHRLSRTILPQLLFDEEAKAHVVTNWIRQNRLDAVVTNRSDFAELISVAGTKVPDEIAVAHLDLPSANDLSAGIVADHHRVGAQAVEQVVSLMRGNQRGLPATVCYTRVPATWKDGVTALRRGVVAHA